MCRAHRRADRGDQAKQATPQGAAQEDTMYATAHLDLAPRGVAAAEESRDDKQRSHAHNTVGCILFQVGRSEEGQAHLEVARDIALAQGAGAELFWYYGNYSDVLIGAGRFAEAIELARQGRAASAERGLARTQGAFMAGNPGRGCRVVRRVGPHDVDDRRGIAAQAAADDARTPVCAQGDRPGAPR
jgi:hypothetical protein